MKTVIILILTSSILLSGELEVDGNLKVTGTVESATIDSLKAVIADLQAQLAALQGAGVLQTRVYEYSISFEENVLYEFTLSEITNADLDNSQNAILYLLDAENIILENTNSLYLRLKYDWDEFNWARFSNNGGLDENITYSRSLTHLNYFGGNNHSWKVINGNASANMKISVTAQFPN